MPQGFQQYRKKRVTFLRGGGESPEKRPYDVSRGQNRYVTLPYTVCLHNIYINYDSFYH